MQTDTLQISGMTCGGCVDVVTRALVAVDGVHNVNVSLENGQAIIDFDGNMTSIDALKQAVDEAGYNVAENNDVAPKTDSKKGCCC